MPSITYRPEIDGLRAIAVIPVVLFHLGFSWMSAGYLGVDVFFVISGFLITTIILKEQHSSAFNYMNFWKRRVRRILPALLTMVIAILTLSYFIAFKPNLQSYAGDACSAMFSYANIRMLVNFGDYWGRSAETSPFLHSWSLSVEEQFYILYPVLVSIIVSHSTKLFKILGLITALSLILFLYSIIAYPNYGFYLLPTRAWEISAGGLLAIKMRSPWTTLKPGHKSLLAGAGILMIIASYFSLSAETIGVASLLPVTGTVLFIGSSSGKDIAGRILGNKLLVAIGKISYSLYLWHWPVIVLSKQYPNRLHYDSTEYLIMTIVIISVVSMISYEFVEKPTRRMKNVIELVVVLFLVAGLISILYINEIIPTRYKSDFNQTEFFGLYYDITPAISATSTANKNKRDGIFAPERDTVFKSAYKERGIIRGLATTTPEIVLIGDSHGAMWAKLIDEVGSELNVTRSIYTMVGNNPIFHIPLDDKVNPRRGFSLDQWFKYRQTLTDNLRLWKPKVLIISCKWSNLNMEDYKNLETMIHFANASNTRVLIINQPPIIDEIGDNNSSQYLSYLGYKPHVGFQSIRLVNNTEVNNVNRKLNLLAISHSNCLVLNINSIYQKDDYSIVTKDSSVLYYDDDHLSYQGTQIAKTKIKSIIEKLIKR